MIDSYLILGVEKESTKKCARLSKLFKIKKVKVKTFNFGRDRQRDGERKRERGREGGRGRDREGQRGRGTFKLFSILNKK